MDLDMEQLKAFYTVARNLSFTRAGDQLALSQPAVSRRIAALEDAAGLKLFVRRGRSLELTDAGRCLYEYVARVLDTLGEAEQILGQFRSLERGKIAVAAEISVTGHLLPRIVSSFQAKHPSIELDIRLRQADEVEKQVKQGAVDLAFWGGEVPPGLHAEPFTAEELTVVVGADHPWVGRTDLQPADIEQECLIINGRGTLLRNMVDEFLLKNQAKASRVWEVDCNDTAKRFVETGLGITFQPKGMLDSEGRRPFHACPSPTMNIPYPVFVVSLKDRHLSPGLLAFVAQLRKS
ncbi:MAG: LysR family transcriptional regulator [Candidatus Desulforudis sp.]|nr:LysR family transcriptional regulator [Desulforudis sp.]